MALISSFSYVLLVLVIASGTAAGWLLGRLAPEEVPHATRWLPKKRISVLIFQGILFFLAASYSSIILILSVLLFVYHLLLGIGITAPKNN